MHAIKQERQPEDWVFIIRQRTSKYQWLTTMDIYSFSFIVFQVSWSSLPSGCQLSRPAIDCRVGSGRQVPQFLNLRSGLPGHFLGNDTQERAEIRADSQSRLRSNYCHSPLSTGQNKSMAKLKTNRVKAFSLHILVVPQWNVTKVVALSWFRGKWGKGAKDWINLPHRMRLLGYLLDKSGLMVTRTLTGIITKYF